MREYTTKAKYVIGGDETITTSLQELIQKCLKLMFLIRPKSSGWVNVTTQELYDEARGVARGLVASGVQPDDRVALLSETRYEWNLTNTAIWMAGVAVVPIYDSSSSSRTRWIIESFDAVFVFAESREHTDRMKPLLVERGAKNPEGESQLRRVLEINAPATDAISYEGRGIGDDEIERCTKDTKVDDLTTVIHTSGIIDRPRDCMSLHSSWLAEVRATLANGVGLIVRPGNRILTFLLLAHVSAHAVSLASMISGVTQSHRVDTETVTLEFWRPRPHMTLGVSRVFERVRNSAYVFVKEKGAFGQAMFERARATAIEYSKALGILAGPSRILKLRRELHGRPLFSKIRAATGEAVQYTVSGGSTLSSNLGHLFRDFGVPVYEGCGLTESMATIIVNSPSEQTIGIVGRLVGGCSAVITSDGEVLLRDPIVSDRYWRNEETTKETFIDGEWFGTDDLGELIEGSHLKIAGREKDLVVTTDGRNVAPGPMEDHTRAHPLASQAVVIGDGRPFTSMLVTLDEEALEGWRTEHSIPEYTSIRGLAASSAASRTETQNAVNSANGLVSHAGAIRKFHILDNDFTEESGELTPTIEVKHNIVMDNYSHDIEALYQC